MRILKGSLQTPEGRVKLVVNWFVCMIDSSLKIPNSLLSADDDPPQTAPQIPLRLKILLLAPQIGHTRKKEIGALLPCKPDLYQT